MRACRVLALSMVTLLAFSGPTMAQETPVGLWKIIDDVSGKPRAILRITESAGAFSGKLEKLFREPGDEPNPRCIACTDARKDQPVAGLTILTGLRRENQSMVWSGGEILDPESGRIYKSKATLTDGGRKLEVRGYFGMPMLGRTQTWLRDP